MFETEWIPTGKPLFMVRVCINKRLNTDKLPSCGGRGSRELADELERRVLKEGLPAEIRRSPCMNNCMIGPNIKIQGAQLFNLNGDMTEARIEEIIAAIRLEVDRRKTISDAPPPAAPQS